MIVIAVALQLIKNIRFIELAQVTVPWEMSVSVITHDPGPQKGEIQASFRNNLRVDGNGSMEI